MGFPMESERLIFRILLKFKNLNILFAVGLDLPIANDAGVAQLVERNLAKVDVTGSNPASRSRFKERFGCFATGSPLCNLEIETQGINSGRQVTKKS